MNHLLEQSIPPLYRDWDLSQFVGADNIDEIKQKISAYLNDPNIEKEGKNIYLYSIENGTGKTSLAYYILNYMKQPRLKRNGVIEYTSVVAVKLANYLKFCNDPYGEDSKRAKAIVETAPFLLLDDVSPWALSSNLHKDKTELVLLMMYRREHLLPTIITSNLTPEHFDKTFGATVSSKVLENFSYIKISGGDIRPVLFPDTFSSEEND